RARLRHFPDTNLHELPRFASLSDEEEDSLTGIGDLRMLPKPRHPVSSHPSDRVLNASSNIRLTQAWGDCPVSILVKRIFVPVLPMVLAIMVFQPRHCQGQPAGDALDLPKPVPDEKLV